MIAGKKGGRVLKKNAEIRIQLDQHVCNKAPKVVEQKPEGESFLVHVKFNAATITTVW